MKLVTHNVDTEEVRQETFQDEEYLVAPVVSIRAMNLDGGYVPKREVRKSAPAWNGTPVTLNHPRNENGQLVSANSPNVAEKTWLGYTFNNRPDDDKIQGELWINIDNARELGGEAEQVLERMENGEPLSVSTSYFGDELPAGEYDGEYRQEVVGNLRPDHLAVLPNKEGRCSIEDGCVAGPQAANLDESSGIRVAAEADDPGNSGEETDGSPEDGEILAETVSERVANTVRSILGSEQTANEPAESGTDDSTMTDREKMVNVLTEEHGFNEESLEGMGDACLERTYNSFVEDDGDSTDDDGGEEEQAAANVDEIVDELEDRFVTEDELGDTVKEAVNEAQEESERRELAAEIVANTDEYEETDAVLDDYPTTAALETKHNQVTDDDDGFADYSAQRGASANAGTDDAGDFPSLTVSENLEGDD